MCCTIDSILNCENNDCEDKIDNLGNPVVIQSETDLWNSSESNGSIIFKEKSGNELTIELSIDNREINDQQCPEIISNKIFLHTASMMSII